MIFARRSPIFAQFSESVGGVSSVRAYDIADQMVAQCDALIDRGNRAFWLMHSSNRWLQIRLEILSACCMAFVCFFIVYGKTTDIGLDAGFGGERAKRASLSEDSSDAFSQNEMATDIMASSTTELTLFHSTIFARSLLSWLR